MLPGVPAHAFAVRRLAVVAAQTRKLQAEQEDTFDRAVKRLEEQHRDKAALAERQFLQNKQQLLRSMCLSLCLRLSMCLSVHLSVCLCICLFFYFLLNLFLRPNVLILALSCKL